MFFFKKFRGRNVDNTHVEGGYCSLHFCVLDRNYIELRRFLSKGASINLKGLEPEKSLKHETPASLTLYRADTFIVLQKALRDAMVDLDTFVVLDKQQVPFRQAHGQRIFCRHSSLKIMICFLSLVRPWESAHFVPVVSLSWSNLVGCWLVEQLHADNERRIFLISSTAAYPLTQRVKGFLN